MENLYANVPRNLSRVKSKVFLNLTARQLLCFGTAVLIGVPLFFASRSRLGTTPASLIMIAVMLIAFAVVYAIEQKKQTGRRFQA